MQFTFTVTATSASTVLESDRQFNLNVRFAPEYRNSIDKIRNINVGYTTPSGATAYIPLSELATVSQQKYKNIVDAWGGWGLFQELLGALKPVADKHRVGIAAPLAIARRTSLSMATGS